MHPAYSVIFFTTASGAGYGLLALLGIAGAFGALHPDFDLGLVAFGIAFALILSGLVSSTGHLGHKERAWRAFSQWRSSWLSREGCAAVATFVPAGLFALGWIVLGRFDGWVVATGLAAAAGSAITVYSTAMIYASLKPIAQWHNGRTVLSYLFFAGMSGLLLLNAVDQTLDGGAGAWLITIALVATLLGLGWKLECWRYNDSLAMPSTLESATGLTGGTVRSVEWPHTEENYLLKEMGFRVARKHRDRLRSIAIVFAFVIPVALLVCALAFPGVARAIVSVFAPLCQLTGLLIERWLFFAEAKHTVSLYYGRP